MTAENFWEILGSDTGVTDDPRLLGCDAVSVGEWF